MFVLIVGDRLRGDPLPLHTVGHGVVEPGDCFVVDVAAVADQFHDQRVLFFQLVLAGVPVTKLGGYEGYVALRPVAVGQPFQRQVIFGQAAA